MHAVRAVSYTHLDVYKRQRLLFPALAKEGHEKEFDLMYGMCRSWSAVRGAVYALSLIHIFRPSPAYSVRRSGPFLRPPQS